MNSILYMRHKLSFAVTLALFFCALLAFATEVGANGNVSADIPVETVEPPIKKSVRKAPVKRPPTKASAKTAVKKEVQPKPPQPTSLEIGILMMEQERYQQACLWLQKAVQEERNNPYAWYWYGMAHDKMGKFQQAQFFYARALTLDPAFPPFARVVTYPDDGDRKALWDPLRPARVYPVEVGTRGVAIVPPDALEATQRPLMPYVDPSLPKVPVYVPPENLSVPGDAIQPPVYVPPNLTEQQPVYVLPENPSYPDNALQSPVYVPPEPPLYPGDALQPPVYVPPEPPLYPGDALQSPVYVPPEPPR